MFLETLFSKLISFPPCLSSSIFQHVRLICTFMIFTRFSWPNWMTLLISLWVERCGNFLWSWSLLWVKIVLLHRSFFISTFIRTSQRALNFFNNTEKSEIIEKEWKVYLIRFQLRALNGSDDHQGDQEMKILRHFHKSIWKTTNLNTSQMKNLNNWVNVMQLWVHNSARIRRRCRHHHPPTPLKVCGVFRYRHEASVTPMNPMLLEFPHFLII